MNCGCWVSEIYTLYDVKTAASVLDEPLLMGDVRWLINGKCVESLLW